MEMEITFPGNLRVDSFYKGFAVNTDQPKDEGGDGTAPEPFDLFLSSIGTCAGIYILYFCRERGIDGAGINLKLVFHRHETTHMVDEINMNILLPPDFPKKYENAVRKVAGMCTVKKHIQTPPQFVISTFFDQ